MNPAEKTTPKITAGWNAGRTEWGKLGFDNFLIGASWSHWGKWPVRQTHIYLGLWVITIHTASKGGKVRKDRGF